MGYESEIILVKKKAFEKVKHLMIAYSFSELYENYLYMWEYPEDYTIPKDEESNVMGWFDGNVFENYFKEKPLEYNESRIIPKDVYENFKNWIENKVKTVTIHDIATKRINDDLAYAYVYVYRLLEDINIDWDNEYVVFRNDW